MYTMRPAPGSMPVHQGCRANLRACARAEQCRAHCVHCDGRAGLYIPAAGMYDRACRRPRTGWPRIDGARCPTVRVVRRGAPGAAAPRSCEFFGAIFNGEGRAHGALMSALVRWPGCAARGIALGVIAVCLPATAIAQRGQVTGHVTDAATKAAIPDVQIRIAGSSVGTLTRADGSYRLVVIRPGTVTLQVLRLGYQAQTREVTVSDS